MLRRESPVLTTDRFSRRLRVRSADDAAES
jgi:hypothetical protein